LHDMDGTDGPGWNVIGAQPGLRDRILNGGLVRRGRRAVAAAARLVRLLDAGGLWRRVLFGFFQILELGQFLLFQIALFGRLVAGLLGLVELLENLVELGLAFFGFQFGHALLLLFLLLAFGLLGFLFGVFHHLLLVARVRMLGRR